MLIILGVSVMVIDHHSQVIQKRPEQQPVIVLEAVLLIAQQVKVVLLMELIHKMLGDIQFGDFIKLGEPVRSLHQQLPQLSQKQPPQHQPIL